MLSKHRQGQSSGKRDLRNIAWGSQAPVFFFAAIASQFCAELIVYIPRTSTTQALGGRYFSGEVKLDCIVCGGKGPHLDLLPLRH